MRVRYVGTGSGVTIPGVGEVQPGGVIYVPDEVGRRLIERPDFEEVEASYVSPSTEYTSNSSSTDITVTTTVTDVQTEQEVKEE